jgi:hypothetical protein
MITFLNNLFGNREKGLPKIIEDKFEKVAQECIRSYSEDKFVLLSDFIVALSIKVELEKEKAALLSSNNIKHQDFGYNRLKYIKLIHSIHSKVYNKYIKIEM